MKQGPVSGEIPKGILRLSGGGSSQRAWSVLQPELCGESGVTVDKALRFRSLIYGSHCGGSCRMLCAQT